MRRDARKIYLLLLKSHFVWMNVFVQILLTKSISIITPLRYITTLSLHILLFFVRLAVR